MADQPITIFEHNTAILGRVGSGKSFMARGVVEGWLSAGRRVVVIDPTDVWWGLRSNADGDGPGYPVIVFGGEHADVEIGQWSGARIAEIIASRNLPAIIATADMTVGERHRFMTDFLGALYRSNRAPLHLVLDEADDVAPQNPLPENRRMLGDVERIVRRGRVRGFRVMMISQRSAVLNKNILTQASVLVAMRLPAKQDRDAIEGWIKGQADIGAANEVLGSLSRLQRGEGWIWAPEQGVLGRQMFPPIRTFDSMRTPEHGEEVSAPTGLATVEIGDLRALLERPAEPGEQEKGNHASASELAAADQRGYERGFRDGQHLERSIWRNAWADVKERLGELDPPLPPATPTPVSSAHPKFVKRELDPPQIIPADGVKGIDARILGALTELDGIGLTKAPRVQVAFLAGYRNTASKGFANAISTLHTRGLIAYPSAGRISLTDSGRARAPMRAKALDNAE